MLPTIVNEGDIIIYLNAPIMKVGYGPFSHDTVLFPVILSLFQWYGPYSCDTFSPGSSLTPTYPPRLDMSGFLV